MSRAGKAVVSVAALLLVTAWIPNPATAATDCGEFSSPSRCTNLCEDCRVVPGTGILTGCGDSGCKALGGKCVRKNVQGMGKGLKECCICSFAGKKALSARCAHEASGGNVTVTLRVENESGLELTSVTAHPLEVRTTGSAALQIVTAPVVRRTLVRNNGHTLKWQGRVRGEGRICVSAEATAQTPWGETVSTGDTDCGCFTESHAPTPAPPPIDTGGLDCECTAVASDGRVLVTAYLECTNRTGGVLSNVTPFLTGIDTTGNVNLLITSGPQPDSVRQLGDRHGVRFKWQGQAPSDARGTAVIKLGATATGPNSESVTAGSVECNTVIIPPRHAAVATATLRPTRTPRSRPAPTPTPTLVPLRPTRTPRATSTRTPTPTRTPARFDASGFVGDCRATASDGKVLVTAR